MNNIIVAKDAGYKDEQIILLENGEIIHFIHGEKGNRDKVYTGDIFVDWFTSRKCQ